MTLRWLLVFGCALLPSCLGTHAHFAGDGERPPEWALTRIASFRGVFEPRCYRHARMSYTPAIDDVEAYVRVQVAVAARTRDELVEHVAAAFELADDEVEPIVDAALQARADELATWPPVTDCDKLDAAFASLRASGVVAHQHFTCCSNCGSSEVAYEIERARELGARIDGYVFYHHQDTDHAVEHGQLNLRYTGALGSRLVEALRAAGLAPEWDGDPHRTIAVPLDWKRRSWPSEAAPPIDHLAMWSERLLEGSRADLAAALAGTYPRLLLELGLRDVAVRWARAARSLATVAGDDEALWCEAFETAPYGKNGALVELLLEADLSKPAISAAAWKRIDEMVASTFWTAALAWWHVKTGKWDDDLLARLHGRFDQATSYTLEASARYATAAALWILRARHDQPVDAMRELALIAFDEYGEDWAKRAVVAAIREVGNLETDGARIPEHDIAHSWLAPKPVPSPATLGEAEAELARRREGYDEGLYTSSEVREAQFDVIRHTERTAAIAALREIAIEERDKVIHSGALGKSTLESVRDGAPLTLPVDSVWASDVGEKRLERARRRWAEAKDRQGRMRARRAGATLLEAAAAFAVRGDRDRARELIDEVLREDREHHITWLAAGALATAWVALGELDRALQVGEASFADPAPVSPIVVALVARGRIDDAVAWLDRALPCARSREAIAVLAPALLALGADAHAMLAAWSRADAALDELLP